MAKEAQARIKLNKLLEAAGWRFFDDGKLKANVNYAYNSGFKWESDNRLKQNAYGLVNAQIGWNAPNDRFSVDVFAKNLTNTKYSVWMVSTTNGDLYAPAAPRLWGAELNFKY